jgi:hypothetical protein
MNLYGNESMQPDALDEPEVIGMLARTVRTRLLDISRSGCLLQIGQRVEPGTVGELSLHIQQDVFIDDVRVTRCVQVEGSGSVYLVGAEFVQTHRPGERSIRRAISRVLTGLSPIPSGATRKPRVVNSAHSAKGEERS